jgi:hypothetical protein
LEVTMNRLFSRKALAITLGAAAALGAATAAQAHTDVSFSIGLPVPPVFVQPAPVYMQPAPVYVQPRPVYVQPRPVVVTRPVVVYQRGWQPSYGRGFDRDRDWRRDDGRRGEWEHREHRWDRSYGRGWE